MSAPITITTAGRAALVNAASTGTNAVTIASIGLSPTAITPTASATTLPGEIKRVAAVGGQMVAADMIHVTMTDASADAYSVCSCAIYLSDGTLFALYGQAAPILTKTAASDGLLAIDIQLADSTASSITFGATDWVNPPATTDVQGVVELATVAEAQAGIDALRALTPAGALAAVVAWLQGKDVQLGVVDAQTPNTGTKGGYCLRLNPATGFGYFQITDAVAGAQYGLWKFDAAGNAGWYGSGLLLHNASTVWSGQTDGSGSGMDTDLWRGQTPAQFLNSAQDAQFGIVRARTPEGAGTNGGYVLSVRDSDGIGLFQVGNAASNEQYGLLTFNRSGLAVWSGTWQAGNVQVGGNNVWHPGNDGAGSGMDTDLWRGQTPAQLLTSAQDSQFGIMRARTPENAGSTGGFVLSVRDSDGIGLLQVTNAALNEQYGLLSVNRSGLASWGTIWQAAGMRRGGLDLWGPDNDGAGSGLDAGLFAGQTPDYYTSIAARLGFTPVRQGGGSGQSTNVIYIGWSGTRLKAQADLTDLGNIVTDDHAFDASIPFNGSVMRRNGSDLWGPENDGAGSGVDTDLWRGQTPDQFIASRFGSGSNGNGYYETRPNGMIESWSTLGAITGEGEVTWTFPYPFTDVASINISAMGVDAAGATNRDIWPQLVSCDLNGCTLMMQWAASTENTPTLDGVMVRAIGR